MPELVWTETGSKIRAINANRTIPSYGTLVLVVRFVSNGVFMTSVVLPEPKNHPPEIISQFREGGDRGFATAFFQDFIERLESHFPATEPVSVSVPSYILVEDGKAIMCLKCGMVSNYDTDVQQRYCGNCDQFHFEHTA
jgi:hypothetical protein